MQLETERLIIREYEAADVDAMQRYCADPEVLRYTLWGPNTPEMTLNFINMAADYRAESPRMKYEVALTLKDSGELIGGSALYITGFNGEIGYTLNRSFWGKGYASEAADALLAYGFAHHGLHRIFATCRPANAASAGVMKRVGMTREGRMREHLWAKGQWFDSELYSILVHEYAGKQKA
ncbi:GNAT family N-acetyltransferase [Gorillibacterium massiliense]|uniref:GNAT family N-acetyltransferase n=1 Tax=Gorillibacterium massiliense TaxID=1280390 RepID=UPI0004B40C04|nr:GNAT family protein [Gorillibacterium massiliense]